MRKRIYTTVVILMLLVTGCAGGHYTNRQLLNILDDLGLRTLETDRGVVVFLPEVYFEFDSSTLTSDAQEKLSDISAVLVHPKALNRRILVEGHTDSRGSEAYNEKLSMSRADIVAEILTMSGVHDNRITRRGYGKKYPIAPNTTPDGKDNPEGRAQNRRVEIVLENTE